MSERAIEMKFNQMVEKIDKIEEIQKITMEAHEAKQTEEKINIRIGKLQNEINEDIKEMKAEVNAGRTIVIKFFILHCGNNDRPIVICKMPLLVSKYFKDFWARCNGRTCGIKKDFHYGWNSQQQEVTSY